MISKMNEVINPLLSVVIPCYNSECYIRECLDSLRAAKSDRVEYILIDGGSADNTMSIVEEYREIFSVVISEKDKGQSDAFNKGFELAQGEYLTWLNSDDVFAPGALEYVLSWIEKDRKPWYAANVVYIDSESKIIKCCQSGSFEKWALPFGILNVFGPSTIFSRKLFDDLGGFGEDFHYSMDTEYWWRIASSGFQFDRIPTYLWALRMHDGAKTASVFMHSHTPAAMLEERDLIRAKYLPNTSKRIRALGIFLVRIYRTLNGAYVKSYLDTRKHMNLGVRSFR